MAGLTALILHHSFFREIRTRITCHGHTSLTGGNGAGKTTSLLLVPIFYGEEPGRLIVQTAGKAPFVDHFLPNAQSMIVFEYERADGHPCCVVLYRPRDSKEFVYRFVEGDAGNTLFHPDLEPHYAGGESAAAIVSAGLQKVGALTSKQIYTTMDYRSIIQNDPHAGGKRRQKGRAEFTMFQEAARFSLARSSVSGKVMQHIEALAGVVLNKSRLISSLEEMVVDSMLRPRIDLTPPSLHQKNQGLWEDIKSFQTFRASDERLRSAVAQHLSLQSSRRELHAHQAAVLKRIVESETALERQEAEQTQLDRERREIESSLESEERDIQSRISQHEGDAGAHQRWLDTLRKAHAEWEAKNISVWQEKLETLPAMREQVAHGENVLRQMRESSKSIQDQHAQRIAELHQAHRDHADAVDVRLNQIQEQREVLRAQQERALEALNEQQRQARIALQEEQTAQAEQLAERRLQAEQQRDCEGQFTEAENERRRQAQAATEAARAAQVQAQEAVQALQQSEREIRETHDAALRGHDQAQERYKKEVELRDGLLRQLKPPSGSLLEFLRQSPLAWQDTIGRAIHPDLLLRKDLSPGLAETPDPKQMYGLILDLRDVDAPDAVDDLSRLEDRYNQAQQQVLSAQNEVQRQERAVHETRKALERVRTERAAADIEVSKAIARVEQSVSSAQKIEQEIEEARRARVEAATAQLNEAREQERTQRSAFQDARSAQEAQQREEHNRLRDQQAQERQEIEANDQAVRRDKDRLKQELRVQLDEQKQLLHAALTEQGIDPDRIQAKMKEVEAIHKDIQTIEAHREMMHQYQTWYAVDWKAKPERETALDEALNHKAKEEDRLRALREQFYQARARIRTKQEALNGAFATLKLLQERRETVIRRTRECLDAIPDLMPEAPERDAPGGSDVDDLVDMLNRTEEERRQVVKRIREAVEQIGQHPGTQIHENWMHLREARRAQSAYSDLSEAFYIELMQDLRVLLEERVPQIEDIIMVNVRAIGGALNEYHDKLKNLDQVAASITRTLERELNAEHEFDEITDVRIMVRSKIHEFGFWKDLHDFAGQWKRWAHEGFSGLPDKALLTSMTGLDSDLKTSDAFTRDLKHLVSLEIQFQEQGRLSPIRRDEDLKSSSSHGLSSIAILILFSALTRFLCPDDSITITWPIDEIGTLSPENVRKIFRMMERHNIHLLCAEPKVNRDLDPYFRHHFRLEKYKGALLIRPPEPSGAPRGHNPLLPPNANDAPDHPGEAA